METAILVLSLINTLAFVFVTFIFVRISAIAKNMKGMFGGKR